MSEITLPKPEDPIAHLDWEEEEERFCHLAKLVAPQITLCGLPWNMVRGIPHNGTPIYHHEDRIHRVCPICKLRTCPACIMHHERHVQ